MKESKILQLVGLTALIMMLFGLITMLFEILGFYMIYVHVKIPLITNFDSILIVVVIFIGIPVFLSLIILYKRGILKIE